MGESRQEREVRELVARHGTLVREARHGELFRLPNGKHVLVYKRAPSEARSWKNTLADVRRALREGGLLVELPHEGEHEHETEEEDAMETETTKAPPLGVHVERRRKVVEILTQEATADVAALAGLAGLDVTGGGRRAPAGRERERGRGAGRFAGRDAGRARGAGMTLELFPGASLPPRLCEWCRREQLSPTNPGRFHGRKCRQAAFRLRRRTSLAAASDGPLRFAYADPPYPGRAKKYYGAEASYGGEVDHRALIASLEARGYAGWALSTAADALVDVLPLCPKGARVAAWVKPLKPCVNTYGLHNTWEPLIVVGGRRRTPGKRDWLIAQPARFEGELMGRKPLAFCGWLFECLGMSPGDELDDLFPGTGIVGRAWAEAGRVAGSSYDARRPTQVATGEVSSVPAYYCTEVSGRRVLVRPADPRTSWRALWRLVRRLTRR